MNSCVMEDHTLGMLYTHLERQTESHHHVGSSVDNSSLDIRQFAIGKFDPKPNDLFPKRDNAL